MILQCKLNFFCFGYPNVLICMKGIWIFISLISILDMDNNIVTRNVSYDYDNNDEK